MISIVIPVYKNKEDFLNNLKQNLCFLKDKEIIIVNDNPKESIKNEVLLIDKKIILIENKENLGFAKSVNIGVAKAKNSYILLLNSDVVIKDINFESLIKKFQTNSKLFAIAFAQIERNKKIVGKNIIYFKNGLIFHKKADNIDPGITAWAEGGAALFDKEKFLYLGGFDELYSPFYWEDIDLSYRGWKSGLEIIFDPLTEVYHFHGTTIKKYHQQKIIETIAFKHQFIFIFKNLDISYLFFTLLWLPYWIVYFLLKKKLEFLMGLILSLFKIKAIVKKRIINKKQFRLKDAQVLKLFQYE